MVGLLPDDRAKAQVDLGTSRSFALADDPDMAYTEIDAYLALADEQFETERYRDWCSSHLDHLDKQGYDWITSADFDRILLETVRATYPPHEPDEFLAHFRGLLGLWARDNAR